MIINPGLLQERPGEIETHNYVCHSDTKANRKCSDLGKICSFSQFLKVVCGKDTFKLTHFLNANSRA